MKARIELSVSSETDLDVRDIVDLMHDALQAAHNIKLEGIIVDKERTKTQLLSEKTDDSSVTTPTAPEGKYGPGTIKVDDGQGQDDSVEEFPPDNNLKPVPVGNNPPPEQKGWATKPSSMTDDPAKHTWNFGTKWI